MPNIERTTMPHATLTEPVGVMAWKINGLNAARRSAVRARRRAIAVERKWLSEG
ncbi:hypothetical protein [Nocardia colli]|uniref:hypothetical protein n=1 Tax=Nocardia colli TaxID=2545717 RepID=UPI0035DF5FE2